MRALTLTQPWASLVVSGQKLVENRPWNPPRALIGHRFAIHASRAIDLDTTKDIFIDRIYGQAISPFATPRQFPLSAIVGVATLERFVREDRLGDRDSLPEDQQRWFFGPVGFVLSGVRALATPIAAKGALSFWQLPADVEAMVRAQLEIA